MTGQRRKIYLTILVVLSAFTVLNFIATFFNCTFRKVFPNKCLDSSRIKFNASGYIDTTNRWRMLDLTTYVFTAYLDDREPCSSVITVLGFGEKREFLFDGALLLRNGMEIFLGKYEKRMLLNPLGNYNMERLGPYAYLWPLPVDLITASSLKSIVVHHTRAGIGKKEVEIPITIPVYSTRTFGVCIDSPLFGPIKPHTIIESIEINKILGAEFFTFYIYVADQTTLQVLQDYAREGMVEVVLNWGHDRLGQLTHYFGQTLSINECVYRNMHRVKYLVYTDLDEFIVPKQSLGWAAMMTKIENSEFGTYLVKHVYFFANSNNTEKGKSANQFEFTCNGSYRMELPSFLTHKLRSRKIYHPKVKSKYITMPLYASCVGVHEMFEHVGNIKTYVVPSDFALLHHYRLNVSDEKVHEYVLDGYASAAYREKILAAMRKRLCIWYGSRTVSRVKKSLPNQIKRSN